MRLNNCRASITGWPIVSLRRLNCLQMKRFEHTRGPDTALLKYSTFCGMSRPSL